ncbi:DUF3850 domain-containing protein [Lysinibacillus parviboronicapiens]|uniref:DUF3850 domain-containing protein n=1 Tax=Lysinibacillus parviboronicapiens TaxID=436516 RepID=UPI0006CFC84F|nr:DUF3850 domain-containing protein [Lysinibacillus parviboronicapiens]
MAKHELKILPEYLESVVNGSKTFEIRKNDRNFSVGDTIFLNEFDGVKTTGRWTERVITYITDYEQKEGYIVMGIARP